MKTRQTGFTLVEIAIVLVIIGLLLGGILKGQEMITQAKIKNVMADFSGISAAYHGYQDRYRAMPGDDANAATRWSDRAAGAAATATATATASCRAPIRRRHHRVVHVLGCTCAAPASSPAPARSSRSTPSPACSGCRPATARAHGRRADSTPAGPASSA